MRSKKSGQSQNPSLNKQVAKQLLENVFEACDMESNTIPLDVLSSYSNYRLERFALQKLVLILIIALFVLLPALFIAPKLTLELSPESSDFSAAYSLHVKSYFMPIERVSAVIDGHNVPVYETDTRSFSIEPTMNGTMTVTVVLTNRQYQTQTVEVTNIDRDTPILLSHSLENGLLHLRVTDGTGAGLDAEKIRALDQNGRPVPLLSADLERGELIFDYNKLAMNIFIPDRAGNTLQLVITAK